MKGTLNFPGYKTKPISKTLAYAPKIKVLRFKRRGIGERGKPSSRDPKN
jgi:hypothetical protein